jgi:hypothetical protein
VEQEVVDMRAHLFLLVERAVLMDLWAVILMHRVEVRALMEEPEEKGAEQVETEEVTVVVSVLLQKMECFLEEAVEVLIRESVVLEEMVRLLSSSLLFLALYLNVETVSIMQIQKIPLPTIQLILVVLMSMILMKGTL